MKESLRTVKVLRIVSVGPAIHLPGPGNKVPAVPCTIAFEVNGRKNSLTLKAIIVQHGDCWLPEDLND